MNTATIDRLTGEVADDARSRETEHAAGRGPSGVDKLANTRKFASGAVEHK